MPPALSTGPQAALALSSVVPADVEEQVFVMPCSAAQVRYWHIDQLSGAQGAVFNIQLALSLKGPLREDILHRSLDALVERHEILRTSFKEIDGTVKQVIHSHASVPLATLDLRGVSEADRPERLKHEIQEEANRPLPLGKKPIFRPMLVRLASDDHVLLLTLHHIVCDGWATGILVREFSTFYQAFFHGTAPELPPLPVQYADYALWQAESVKTPEHARQLAYWNEQLSQDIPILDFPTDFPRRSGQAFPSTIATLLLPRELSETVVRLSREWDTTPYVLLFATYILLLSRYSGQSRFIVGTVVANRPRVELEGVVGAFANPVILRADLSGEPTVRTLLDSTREMVLGSFDHQEVPFENILQALEFSGGAHRKPTIQTFFFFQRAFLQPAEFAGITMRPIRSVTPGTTFEQTLAIIERGEGMRLQIDYNTDLFKPESIQRFLQGFQILLEGMVADPDALASELPMLTPQERGALEVACDAALQTPGQAARPAPREVLDDLDTRFRERWGKDSLTPRCCVEPAAGTSYLVLDERLRAASPGVPGDVYVLGANSAGEDAKQYAWAEGPADRATRIPLLKTDYLGRVLPDGRIEFWGKSSDFAVFRGFRINLHEIEAHLLGHPRIADSAALKDELTGKLTCYVVLKGPAARDEPDLRGFLREKISDLVPLGPIYPVPFIARDPRGKVLTNQLQVGTMESSPGIDANPDMLLYQQLAEIWKEILKIPDVAIDDNFFDLGGSSFQAVRMMTQIEKAFGKSLPLSLLLKGATLSNLARVISGKLQEDGTSIQVVQPKGTRPPVFFLHGDWAGGGFYCNRIARTIGEDRPFYAIPPYRNSENNIISMEAMAASHIASMKELVPTGPYVLGGYCIGATLAIEVARQLLARGDVVDHVFLVDPALKRVSWLRPAWAVVNKIGLARGWSLRKRMVFHDRYPVALDRWLKLSFGDKKRSMRHRFLHRDGEDPPNPADSIPILNSVEYGVYMLANRLSKLKPLSIPATFYYPLPLKVARQQAELSQLDPAKISVEELPGTHVTCITKYVTVLAQKLKTKLDEI